MTAGSDSTPSPARHQGINRIIVGVWDLDAGMAAYEKLLGAPFRRGHGEEAASFGVEVAFSWEAGVEMVAPLPDRESAVRAALDERGEGILGVVFAVRDADASAAAATEMGMPTYYSLDYDQDIIDERLGGRYSVYREHFIEARPPFSGTLLLGEFADRAPSG